MTLNSLALIITEIILLKKKTYILSAFLLLKQNLFLRKRHFDSKLPIRLSLPFHSNRSHFLLLKIEVVKFYQGQFLGFLSAIALWRRCLWLVDGEVCEINENFQAKLKGILFLRRKRGAQRTIHSREGKLFIFLIMVVRVYFGGSGRSYTDALIQSSP